MFTHLKKILLLAATFSVCTAAQAEIIELDNKNPDHCRQQILSAQDETPVVLAYFDWCEPAKKFIKNVYEPVANELTDRAFFKFNMGEESDWQAYSQCLQLAGHIGSPSAMIYFKLRDPQTGSWVMAGPIRMGGSGNMTKEEFLKLIDPYSAKQSVTLMKK